jgi:hypothetical protein
LFSKIVLSKKNIEIIGTKESSLGVLNQNEAKQDKKVLKSKIFKNLFLAKKVEK